MNKVKSFIESRLRKKIVEVIRVKDKILKQDLYRGKETINIISAHSQQIELDTKTKAKF